jgi:hypothetical protein
LRPRSLPSVPKAVKVEYDGKEYAAFDLAGMQTLLAMRKSAKVNYEILTELIYAYNSLVEERNALMEMLKESEERSNILARKWAQTEGELQAEKDLHKLDNLIQRTLLVVGAILAVI